MLYPINYKDINADTEYAAELKLLYRESENYLKSFSWCKEILSGEVYVNLGRVFSLFLFEIENIQSKEDNILWVIGGDLPFMYLDTAGAKSTKEAVNAYVHLASDWIECVKNSEDTSECYPFDAEPTLGLADLLEKRTSFIKNTLIDNIDDIELAG